MARGRNRPRARRLPRAGRRGGRGEGPLVIEPLPVRTQGLVKRHGKVVAVDHVELRVQQGDAFGYLGPKRARKAELRARTAAG